MFDYEALCAKCRAAYGGMLKHGDYERLAASTSLSAVAERLASMPGYAERFDGGDIQSVNRSYIEYAAAYKYFELIVRLSGFAKGEQAEFLRNIAEEYEIKYLVRALYMRAAGSGELYTAVPDYVRKYSRLDFVSIISAHDNKGVIAALEGTRYHAAALSELLKNTPDISRLETVWYGEYYERLYGEYTDALDKKSRDAVRALYEKHSDIKKIQVLFRQKKYGFSEEQISAAGIAKVAKKTRGKNLEYKRDEMYNICVRALHTGKNDMSVAVALLMIAATELNNIIHLTEGIRYGEDQRTIMEKIICR